MPILTSIKISDFCTCNVNNSCDYIPFVRNTNGDGVTWDTLNYKTLAENFTANYAATSSLALTASYSLISTSSSYALSSSYAYNANTASFALGGGIIVLDSGINSTVRCGANNYSTGDYSIVAGGTYNSASGDYSGILGGQCNDICRHANTFIIGSQLSASCDNTTFVNNINVQSGLTLGGVTCVAWPSSAVGTAVIVADAGTISSVRCGANNCVTGNCSTIVGGCGNKVLSDRSGILGGVNNSTQGYTDAFIIGSNISASNSCTTFVNNICVFGNATLTASNSISASYAKSGSYSLTASYANTASYSNTSTLANSASFASYALLTGDVVGDTTNTSVQKIWGVPLSASAEIPVSSSALTFNGTMWIPYVKPSNVVIEPYITNILITNLGKQDDTFNLYSNNSKIVGFGSGWQPAGRTWEIQYAQKFGTYSMRLKNSSSSPWIYGTVIATDTGPKSSLVLLTNNSGGDDHWLYFQSTTTIVVTTNNGGTYTWRGNNPIYINGNSTTINPATNYANYTLQFNVNISNISSYLDVITLRNQSTNIVW